MVNLLFLNYNIIILFLNYNIIILFLNNNIYKNINYIDNAFI